MYVNIVKNRNEAVQQAKMVLDRLQTTYQTQFMEYEVQAKAAAELIKQLKNAKEVTKDQMKLGIKRIRMIVEAWRDREDKDQRLFIVGMEWMVPISGGTPDTPGRCGKPEKAGDNFYKMDEESIVTIREDCLTTFCPC